ncbi:hypothetical protein SASPL_112454 [Salvia splendens]|uniref:Viridiflorene synthase n=1 Tax=Salvia splendens TaxID=180675 RepID=A0A8X9A4L3_SALSN|nr:hypothetical protein SASPL_112454 [Salvia splendens]
MAPPHSQAEIQRPVANFSPSLWGDQFIKHGSAAQAAQKHSNAVEVCKKEVLDMMAASENNLVEAMNLIDTLERLGISYHFENEIEDKLHHFFNLNTDYSDAESYDLYTVALHFRLFRQHGHRLSSRTWIDEKGKFQESLKNDGKGLLSLYEASYLRTRGETILDDALEFATATLKSIAPHLESPLSKQVVHALIQPLHYGNPRIEARNFISVYEEYQHKNESLLRFAKLDYNLLQMLHKEELDEVSRWNIEEMDKLPEYVRPFYKALLELYEQFEEELAKEGRSYAAHYAIESLKELVRSYHVEAKWFIQGYLPPFEEYLKNALITCTYCYHTTTALLGDESATKEDFEWLSEKPKMLVAGLLICRVIDDIATYEVEKERGQSATGIESYMRDNGATIEEAVAKFFEIATEAWKDINEECMRPSPYSRDVLMRILNLERIIDVTYKGNEDGYTQPEKVLKPHIVALFVDPVETQTT